MTSKVGNQLELLPSAVPHEEPLTPDVMRSIKRRPTFLSAWNFAIDFSALEDKQVYSAIDIDASHWSKIRSGRASPPGDERLVRFFDVVRNEIPLVWLAEARGYDWTTIRKHRSAHERELAEVQSENRDLRRTLALLLDAQKAAR